MEEGLVAIDLSSHWFGVEIRSMIVSSPETIVPNTLSISNSLMFASESLGQNKMNDFECLAPTRTKPFVIYEKRNDHVSQSSLW